MILDLKGIHLIRISESLVLSLFWRCIPSGYCRRLRLGPAPKPCLILHHILPWECFVTSSGLPGSCLPGALGSEAPRHLLYLLVMHLHRGCLGHFPHHKAEWRYICVAFWNLHSLSPIASLPRYQQVGVNLRLDLRPPSPHTLRCL